MPSALPRSVVPIGLQAPRHALPLLRALVLSTLAVTVVACGGGGGGGSGGPQPDDGGSSGGGGSDGGGSDGGNGGAPDPVARGDRTLGIDVLSFGDGVDFGGAAAEARDAGAEYFTLQLQWDEFETTTPTDCAAPGAYRDPSNILLAIHEAVPSLRASGVELRLALTTNAVFTDGFHLPDNFDPTVFSGDPAAVGPQIDLIACRFEAFLDFAFDRILFGETRDAGEMPAVEIETLAIGNEPDLVVGENDAAFWENYARFFDEVAEHARGALTERTGGPAPPVTLTATYSGITGDLGTTKRDGLAELYGDHADLIGVTYYPLSGEADTESGFEMLPPEVVGEQFDTLMERARAIEAGAGRDLPVAFEEFGYPSSDENGVSEADQAEFFQAFFESWDQYRDEVPYASVVRLYDLSEAGADQSVISFFGDPPNAPDAVIREYRAYVRTLGLIAFDGRKKPSYTVLKEATETRSW